MTSQISMETPAAATHKRAAVNSHIRFAYIWSQFSSVQYEYLYSAIKQDVALRPGSKIKTNKP